LGKRDLCDHKCDLDSEWEASIALILRMGLPREIGRFIDLACLESDPGQPKLDPCLGFFEVQFLCQGKRGIASLDGLLEISRGRQGIGADTVEATLNHIGTTRAAELFGSDDGGAGPCMRTDLKKERPLFRECFDRDGGMGTSHLVDQRIELGNRQPTGTVACL